MFAKRVTNRQRRQNSEIKEQKEALQEEVKESVQDQRDYTVGGEID